MLKETRIVLKNAGRISPESIDDYLAADGYQGLKKALSMEPAAIIDELIASGLRGRGGAGFSTGTKNRFTSDSCPECPEHFLIVNADEGEPGTFKDRIIMENDPHLFIEGAVISARSIRARKGYIYIRGEYTRAIELTRKAIEDAYRIGVLGENILGSGFHFDLEIKLGAGSYLCGEELTLIESLEGKRGNPRIKPPYPAEIGLFGQPTLVNNVETLANIPSVIVNGNAWYRRFGTEKSPGTKLFTLSGKVKKPGCYEVELGATLQNIIFDLAGGMLHNNKPFKAALLGGAAGTFVDSTMLHERMTYENLHEKGLTLGSGAIIVLEEGDQVSQVLLNCLRFFKHESCGKCVPCRVGTTFLEEKARELFLKKSKGDNLLEQMVHQSEIIAATSLCPLGQSPVLPIKSAIRFFSKELAL
jgi:NADH:ubiquinone oxidoreductase subunit F (NADH-binding)